MMVMEGQEEVVLCTDQLQIIKGKRAKHPRLLSPLTLAMASSTSTSSSNGGESGRSSDHDDDSKGYDRAVASSTTTSVDQLAESSTEEEDMAYCLILLAQGRQTRQPSETAATTSKTGIYVHQCKTCNRCFPSFQALGGHRASHKKPKAHNEENTTKGLLFVKDQDDDDGRFNNMNTTLSLQITNKVVSSNSGCKSKVHECSICGAEFSSGQALGGHMRRHRTFASAATATTATTTTTTLTVGTRSDPPESEDHHQLSKKPRTVLQLDLNLPAPEDDHNKESHFPLATEEKLLVFSASSLVDCHY